MSAFVVDPSTMTRIVRAICGEGEYGRPIREFAGIFTDAPDAATRIGRRLFAMNIESVMQRYPDTRDKPDNLPGMHGCNVFAETYTCTARPHDRRTSTDEWIAAIKAIECLTYQSCEGNVDETDLYRETERASERLALFAVRRLPAYDKAKWG